MATLDGLGWLDVCSMNKTLCLPWFELVDWSEICVKFREAILHLLMQRLEYCIFWHISSH